MSESTEQTPQPTTNSPAEVDWSTPDADEVRLPPPAPDPADQPNEDNASLEGDDEPEKPVKEAAADDDDPIGDDPEETATDDEPPEFWSTEKKALWSKVADPEVRAAIKEHVRDIAAGTARKLEENAKRVQAAEESSKQAIAKQEQDLAFWQQTGPVVAALIEGEFANVDMDKLARENPGEWAAIKQAKEARQAWVRGIAGHIQEQQKQVDARRKEYEHSARIAEHGKLAAKYPKEFGTPEASERAYKALAGFLAEQGIPADRISQTYEAPIVEIVRMAYKYKQLQAKAKVVTTPKQPAQSASTTPTRVVPGARSSANPVNDATRQAVERLKSGERLTSEEAGWAFR
jgi:hypothetical protein